MGKIRVKTFGDEASEAEEKQKKAVKKAEKQARVAADTDTSTETKEEPQTTNKTSEEVQNQTETDEIKTDESTVKTTETNTITTETSVPKKTKKEKFIKKKIRSAKYKAVMMEIDKNKVYPLSEGLELLRKVKITKFDETVELHINTTEAGISGQVKLPHGNGKEIKVAIATDDILGEVEKGKINFDILIATPSQMPKLAKVARVLGPRGLMPNPKNGTISENPDEAAKKFQGGQINFKTESKNPIIHLSVGKTSFEDKALAENIKTVVLAIKRDRIRKITLKSTMSPAIRLTV